MAEAGSVFNCKRLHALEEQASALMKLLTDFVSLLIIVRKFLHA